MAERTVIGRGAAMPRAIRGIVAAAVVTVAAGCTAPESGREYRSVCQQSCSVMRARRAVSGDECPCVDRMIEGACTAAGVPPELRGLTSPTATPVGFVAEAPVVPIPLLVVVPRAQGCRAILGAQCIACDAFRCDGMDTCWCDDTDGGVSPEDRP